MSCPSISPYCASGLHELFKHRSITLAHTYRQLRASNQGLLHFSKLWKETTAGGDGMDTCREDMKPLHTKAMLGIETWLSVVHFRLGFIVFIRFFAAGKVQVEIPVLMMRVYSCIHSGWLAWHRDSDFCEPVSQLQTVFLSCLLSTCSLFISGCVHWISLIMCL